MTEPKFDAWTETEDKKTLTSVCQISGFKATVEFDQAKYDAAKAGKLARASRLWLVTLLNKNEVIVMKRSLGTRATAMASAQKMLTRAINARPTPPPRSRNRYGNRGAGYNGVASPREDPQEEG